MGLLEQLVKNMGTTNKYLESISNELSLIRFDLNEAMDLWENENQGEG